MILIRIIISRDVVKTQSCDTRLLTLPSIHKTKTLISFSKIRPRSRISRHDREKI